MVGASGQIGRALVAALVAAGHHVRAISRRPATATAGVTPITADLDDAEALAHAFAGADAAFAMLPYDPGAAGYHATALRRAEVLAGALRRAAVPRVVALSSAGADAAGDLGLIAPLAALEAYARALPAEVCVLRPGSFFENFAGALPVIRAHGVLADAVDPEVALPMVATADIAAAAADALLDAAAPLATRALLGPRDLTHAEVAGVLGRALGLPALPYVRLVDAEMEAALCGAGFAPDVAAAYTAMTRAFNTGRIASGDVRRVDPAATTATRFEDHAPLLAAAYRTVGA